MRILLVDDEVSFATKLKRVLEKNMYTVDIVSHDSDTFLYLDTYHYDCIVIDFPKKVHNFYNLLQTYRNKKRNIFILVIGENDVNHYISCLENGADNYLSKPFSEHVFIVCVKSLLHRSPIYLPNQSSLGNTTLDHNSYLLETPSQKTQLNKKEYQLMGLFFHYPQHIFSANELMERVWGIDSDAEIDVVWTYIGFLRKKLKLIESTLSIQTVRGVGYTLQEKGES